MGFAGGLACAMASIRIPEAIPSPRDVRHVIFEIESSNVLLAHSNAANMSFFRYISSFVVLIRR